MSEARRDAARANAALAAAIERWALPSVEGALPPLTRIRDVREAAAVDSARQQAEAAGYEAGLQRAQQEHAARLAALDAAVASLDTVLRSLAAPLSELDEQAERELLQLALLVGKQLARRELRIDPAQVIAVIREALAQLPAAAREARVHLHPEDAAIVRERLAAGASERAWQPVEDPTLSRGGCVVRTEHAQVDARFESRVTALIASALGEERAVPRRAAGAEPAPEGAA